jgi:hypothetical protein
MGNNIDTQMQSIIMIHNYGILISVRAVTQGELKMMEVVYDLTHMLSGFLKIMGICIAPTQPFRR